VLRSGLSLANKCQLLFGAAVVLLIGSALVVPWLRLETVVDQAHLDTARQIARLREAELLIDPAFARVLQATDRAERLESDLKIRFLPLAGEDEADAGDEPAGDGFIEQARRRITPREDSGDAATEEYAETLWDGGVKRYRLARLIRDEGGEPKGVLVVERRSSVAASQVFVDRMILIVAGLGAGLLSVLVFYLITTRLILGPVRSLRDTAEVVEAGNLHVRSAIQTGDEFEQLSEAFNSMLETLSAQQSQLRAVNKTLDLKLNEMAERNLALYEAARMKGEFLANVSHELRTPLNSIIGFAEILMELAEAEAGEASEADGADLAKRRRYLGNILAAGRSLLEMINELLTMAKIDAGTVEVNVQPVNAAEMCEGLVALIRPLAERKGQALSVQLQGRGGTFTAAASGSDLPLVETDPQKLQQIVFNFLSNAVKFTPDGGEVTLRVERSPVTGDTPELRISVLDTGPGIPADKRDAVFEKFTQLESGHTRAHQGTGLGLAIAREFASMLGGEIQLESDEGRGSMFSLIVPVAYTPPPAPPAPELPRPSSAALTR
jgi:two-component system sensor histidine kinase BarA